MSRLSLMETLQLLEKEFEEAESSYSLDSRVEQGVVNVEWTVDKDLEVISPPSVEESELPTEDTVILGDPILSQPVMASSFVNDDSTSPLEPLMIEVPESFSLAPDQAIVRLELSDEDKKEVDVVESFMDKTCGCKGGPAKTPCSMLFIKDVVMSYRSDCFALTREQLDLVVTAQLSAFRTHKSSIPPSYRGSADNFALTLISYSVGFGYVWKCLCFCMACLNIDSLTSVITLMLMACRRGYMEMPRKELTTQALLTNWRILLPSLTTSHRHMRCPYLVAFPTIVMIVLCYCLLT